jgi:hypothetical protein
VYGYLWQNLLLDIHDAKEQKISEYAIAGLVTIL